MPISTSNLKLIYGGIGLITLLAVFATQRIPEPEAKIIVEQPQFDDTWHEAVVAVALRSASLFDTAPKPIKTITIKPEPVVTVLSEEKINIKPRHIHIDVCQRHKMHKVQIRGGKSWRCRR